MPIAPTPPTRPVGCPPSASIDAALTALGACFATFADSDMRAKCVDNVINAIPTPCFSAAQIAKLHGYTSQLDTQAGKEAKSFDVFGTGLTGTVVRVAVGALGVTLILLGFLMIGGEAELSSAANKLGKAIRGK